MGRGYGQYCPIAKAAEILAERWTPLIVRNIYLRSHSFSDIHRGCPRMSKTLLAQRLRTLERAQVIERVAAPAGRGSRYYLTPAGQELAEVVLHMGTWGARWLDLAPADYDAGLVLWACAKCVDASQLPARRVIVRFDVSDDPNKHFWMLLQRPEPEICVKNPDLGEDLIVAADTVTLTDIHRGRLGFSRAAKTGRLTVRGPLDLARGLPAWVGLSPYATVKPAAQPDHARATTHPGHNREPHEGGGVHRLAAALPARSGPRFGHATRLADPAPLTFRDVVRAVAVPRCGGPRGWRSRAGNVPVPGR